MMQRLVAYTVAGMASMLGWRLGSLQDPFLGFFLALLTAAVALYLTRRYLQSLLG
jgi:hypothetical protein